MPNGEQSLRKDTLEVQNKRGEHYQHTATAVDTTQATQHKNIHAPHNNIAVTFTPSSDTSNCFNVPAPLKEKVHDSKSKRGISKSQLKSSKLPAVPPKPYREPPLRASRNTTMRRRSGSFSGEILPDDDLRHERKTRSRTRVHRFPSPSEQIPFIMPPQADQSPDTASSHIHVADPPPLPLLLFPPCSYPLPPLPQFLMILFIIQRTKFLTMMIQIQYLLRIYRHLVMMKMSSKTPPRKNNTNKIF